MKKYRIVQVTTFYSKEYYVQKRFLGFLWWYNIEDLYFRTLEEAREALQALLYKTKKTVIDEI